MLTAFVEAENRLHKQDASGGGLPADSIWIDMLRPTRDEERAVEAHLGLEVPTHEDMLEIEASSRVYHEGDALFMTAILLTNTESDVPEATPVSFVLSRDTLVTIRYGEPRPIDTFAARAERVAGIARSGEAVLIGLLETIVDRAADILERLALEIEGLSREVFEHQGRKPSAARELRDILRNIGHRGDLNGKARESFLSLRRVLIFLTQGLPPERTARELRVRLKTLTRDLDSLTDHASFLSGKVGFLLDATLGMINIEQNAIIKIFSVAAVMFLPPTLIASIYGMNFDVMPELDWPFGYPLAIGLMIASAVVPYLTFKRRGWL